MHRSWLILTNFLYIDGWQEHNQTASCDQKCWIEMFCGYWVISPKVGANTATLSSSTQSLGELPGILAPQRGVQVIPTGYETASCRNLGQRNVGDFLRKRVLVGWRSLGSSVSLSPARCPCSGSLNCSIGVPGAVPSAGNFLWVSDSLMPQKSSQIPLAHFASGLLLAYICHLTSVTAFFSFDLPTSNVSHTTDQSRCSDDALCSCHPSISISQSVSGWLPSSRFPQLASLHFILWIT